MIKIAEQSDFDDNFLNKSIKTSAMQRLELMRETHGANEILMIVTDEKVPGLHGEIFKSQIKIKNGPPIRAEGKTQDQAKENLAAEILRQIDAGTLIFNPYKQLEFHKKHEDKFSKKQRKHR